MRPHMSRSKEFLEHERGPRHNTHTHLLSLHTHTLSLFFYLSLALALSLSLSPSFSHSLLNTRTHGYCTLIQPCVSKSWESLKRQRLKSHNPPQTLPPPSPFLSHTRTHTRTTSYYSHASARKFLACPRAWRLTSQHTHTLSLSLSLSLFLSLSFDLALFLCLFLTHTHIHAYCALL